MGGATPSSHEGGLLWREEGSFGVWSSTLAARGRAASYFLHEQSSQ